MSCFVINLALTSLSVHTKRCLPALSATCFYCGCYEPEYWESRYLGLVLLAQKEKGKTHPLVISVFQMSSCLSSGFCPLLRRRFWGGGEKTPQRKLGEEKGILAPLEEQFKPLLASSSFCRIVETSAPEIHV